MAAWAKGEPGRTVRLGTYRKAISAVNRIAASSEMLDLWSDSDHFAEWQAVIADLQRRLAVATAP